MVSGGDWGIPGAEMDHRGTRIRGYWIHIIKHRTKEDHVIMFVTIALKHRQASAAMVF